MYDVAIRLEEPPGAMAEMGETLGTASVSVEAAAVGSQTVKATVIFTVKRHAECWHCTVLEVREVLVKAQGTFPAGGKDRRHCPAQA